MKNVFVELISRLDKAKERISELFLKTGKQRKEKLKKKKKLNRASKKGLWGNYKRSNIHIVGKPKEER